MRRLAVAIGAGILLSVACGKSAQNSHRPPAAGTGGDAAGAPPAGGVGATTSGAAAGEAGGATIFGGAGGGATEAGAAGEPPGGVPSAEGGAAGAPIDDWSVGGDNEGGAPTEGAVSGTIELVQRPAPGATVRINGVSKLTEADGSFTFDDVAAEYDLTVIYQPGKAAKVIEGLTTRHPDVVLGYADQSRSASVAGELSGGAGFPLPTGYGASVAMVFPDVAIGSVVEDYLFSPAASYELTPHWAGPASIDGELVALQWQNGFMGPKAFPGFARVPLTFADGQTIGDVNGSVAATNLELTAPTTTSYDGTLSSDGFYDDLIPLLEIGPFSLGFTNDVGDFSALTPDVDLPIGISVLAEQDVSRQMEIYVPRPEPGTAWRVSVPRLPTLLAPKDQAVVTLETPFQWQGMPEHALAHSSWFIDGWNVERVTRSTSTTIPDLTADGVPTSSPVLIWFLDAIGPADRPEQSLAVQAHRVRRQRVRSFSTYLSRTFELTE